MKRLSSKSLLALPILAGAALFSAPASAACEKQVAAAQKASGTAVAPAFQKVIACDAKIAGQTYPTLLGKTENLEGLMALSMVAIENDVWNPVWQMPGKIKDYDTRDAVTAEIGAKCSENEKVVSFLQGAYYGVRDIEFARWEDALVTCQSETFDTWLETTVTSPPPKAFDDKYAKVLDIYVERKGVEALGTLSQAGIKAAENGGPFSAVLSAMDASVAPSLGEELSEEDQKALEGALVEMAKQLPPEQAKDIADRLSNAGSQSAAASLLPAIYPDRVRGGNSFVYGGIAVEAGECKGEKTAVLHVSEVQEPGSRYIIGPDAEAGLRAAKPKLKKCTMDDGPWQVFVSPEPLAEGGMDSFYAEIEAQWVEKGYEVKRKDEAPVALD